MKNIELWFGDCLELMDNIPEKSIDMVFADLPYGTTYQNWDKIIDMKLLWEKYDRIVKDNCPLVFTASQPFTSLLICSKLDWFRCEWIWDKENPTNFANANIQPLKQHESVIVFSRKSSNYYPQKVQGKINHKQGNSKNNSSEIRLINTRVEDDLSGLKFPKSILYYPKHSSQCKNHPNEKMVNFIEYFIRTYSKENDTILDNTMGSGSSGVASKNLNRKYIGIENNQKYFDIATQRILEESKEN